jgi:uncharacterized lipoprotein YmbA
LRSRTKYAVQTARVLSVAGLLVLTGCVSLGRGAPAEQHYVLGGNRPWASAAPERDFSGIKLGVRRLQLAAYLESPFVLVRSGANQVGFSEFHRWAESLGGGINRALSGYLGDRASFQAIDVAPWPTGERYDFVLQVHVLRFEGVAPEDALASDGEVLLKATWEVLQPSSGVVLSRGATDYREGGWRVGDYAGLLTLLDAGLHVLTDEILQSLDEAARTAVALRPPSSGSP